jgi:tRNA U34 2-thiouridine synthase MnmA/TrmU
MNLWNGRVPDFSFNAHYFRQMSKIVTALGLFSGGLDSILACRIIADQGVRVRALKFVTPFFDHDLLASEEEYKQEVKKKYGIDVELVDVSDGYIELLRNPAHGFGKNFNPCIDCKILMLSRAKEIMDETGASFLITGEVLGQRPMSQRRDTLNVIERDAACRTVLLRPLSAQLMEPTVAEENGWVARDKLFAFAGRGRKPQIQLAKEMGITEFPAPAGGCVLTDPNLAARIERFYAGLFSIGRDQFQVDDIKLLLVGRQFCLPGGHWLVLGRNEKENERLAELKNDDDWFLFMPERPGPTALLRRASTLVEATVDEQGILRMITGLVVRYGRKIDGKCLAGKVRFECKEKVDLIDAEPLEDAEFRSWIV